MICPRAVRDYAIPITKSLLAAALLLACCIGASAGYIWTSPCRHRVLLSVNPTQSLSNSPVSVDLDFPQMLANAGDTGAFDENTLEVIAYESSVTAKVYDSSRAGYEKYLLPWRIDKYYKLGKVTLSFVLTSRNQTQYAVYFDTNESGLGRPDRYRGIVGDGDFFSEEYKRREIGAGHMETFCDFDGDGDLDLFKVTLEPYIYCYENVGGARFEDRGRMTSGGSLFVMPNNGENRSWPAVRFCDWDGDGDQDLFASFTDGSDAGYVVRFKNTTIPGGLITFTRVTGANNGRLLTVTGKTLVDTWFTSITFLDWDGDGKTDVLSTPASYLEFNKNTGSSNDIADMQLQDGVRIRLSGSIWDLYMSMATVDCADADSDGDLDMFAATGGYVYYYQNIGTRTSPSLTTPQILVSDISGNRTGIKVADFDGDGLLDFVCDSWWFTKLDTTRMYKNVGTLTSPQWSRRDATNGCPYTLRFQPTAIVRQNDVRSCDWDQDGKMDLIAGDMAGYVWWFRNTGNRLFPVFQGPQHMVAGGQPIVMNPEGNSYSRTEVCDWNNDGLTDLIVCDVQGGVFRYMNVGTPGNPVLAAGAPVTIYNGHPIDTTGRSSAMVCDWDNDGKKDLIVGMGGNAAGSLYTDWPWQGTDPNDDIGFLFYRNTGTDAAPVLGYPSWITGGGSVISYGSRPNLGKLVDWDGDGKKDFIACRFEHEVYFHKNTGSGGSGQAPTFANNQGVYIVWEDAPQMISGADVLDWNGDADLDILTGQGHGGTSLRFYERDFINKSLNSGTPPLTVQGTDRPSTLTEAKAAVSGGPDVTLEPSIVTAAFSQFFYVESADRRTGIKVSKTAHGVSPGQLVTVYGKSWIGDTDGERYIAATGVIPIGTGSVGPLALSTKSLGGSSFLYNAAAGAGQQGTSAWLRGNAPGVLTDLPGLNNTGLLVTIFGRVAGTAADHFFVDDGSMYDDGDPAKPGVKVALPAGVSAPQAGWYVSVTGISSCYKTSPAATDAFRLLRARSSSDIVHIVE